MTAVTVSSAETGRTCPYCRFPLKGGTTAERCDACGGLHHEDCWNDGGGCAVFGCANAGAAAARTDAPGPVPAGAPLMPPPPPGVPASPPPAGATSGPPAAVASLEIPRMPLVGGVPLELWLVIAAFALPGVWLVIKTLQALPDAIQAMQYEFGGFRLGLALLLLLLVIGAIGAGMIWIAWRLHQHDRVARGLAFVVTGAVILSVLLSTNNTGSEWLAVVGAAAGAAILGLSPAVRELFAGADQADVPTSIIVGRVTLVLFCLFAGLIAVTYFLLATFEGRYVVTGLVLAALVVASLALAPRLMTADRQARVQLTILIAIGVVLVLALGRFWTGLLFPTALAVTAIGTFWLPPDARRHFGDEPLTQVPGT